MSYHLRNHAQLVFTVVIEPEGPQVTVSTSQQSLSNPSHSQAMEFHHRAKLAFTPGLAGKAFAMFG